MTQFLKVAGIGEGVLPFCGTKWGFSAQINTTAQNICSPKTELVYSFILEAGFQLIAHSPLAHMPMPFAGSCV